MIRLLIQALAISLGAVLGSLAAIGLLTLMYAEPPREEFNCDRTGLDPNQIIIVCPEERKIK